MKKYFVETEENRKRYIKQENKLIGLAIVSIYGFNLLASNLSYILRRFDKRDSVDDMKTSISDNTNINEEEKKYLNGIDVFINDYEKYIDVPFACDKLENFHIIYKECDNNGSYVTKGTWSKSKEEIIYYITKDESKETKQRTINHELLHLISSHDGNYPGILNEGVTSVICYEYNFDTDCYDKYRLITYMLCEVVSSDVVIKSYLMSDYSIIENKLYEIIPDKNLIAKLSDSFDNCGKYVDSTKKMLGIELNEDEQKKFNKYKEKLNKSLDDISKILSRFYMIKTGKLIGDSKIVQSMYDYGCYDAYNDYDLKMSIYSSELIKDDIYCSDKSYNNEGKLTFKYGKNNKFDAITDYFNKRNKNKVGYYDNENWGFAIHKNILESNLIDSQKYSYIVKEMEEDINRFIKDINEKEYKKIMQNK